mmetsp:Transcript_49973/g.128612  ORF Transcript_49973/g.128612 Transcript_49973/m.128612 type:complete len:104 (-) Transcript_49973:1328-1639(-)
MLCLLALVIILTFQIFLCAKDRIGSSVERKSSRAGSCRRERKEGEKVLTHLTPHFTPSYPGPPAPPLPSPFISTSSYFALSNVRVIDTRGKKKSISTLLPPLP